MGPAPVLTEETACIDQKTAHLHNQSPLNFAPFDQKKVAILNFLNHLEIICILKLHIYLMLL
jgi:hypothetical protein